MTMIRTSTIRAGAHPERPTFLPIEPRFARGHDWPAAAHRHEDPQEGGNLVAVVHGENAPKLTPTNSFGGKPSS